MKAIEGIGITFSHDGKPLIQTADIHVCKGECVALTGPSGCGKSTLCYILSGIIPRTYEGDYTGSVRLYGDDIKTLSLEETVKRIGIVFQNPDSQLFSPTVEDEIAFGPENLCLMRGEIEDRITVALSSVGMQDYRFANPAKLSGGQKQLIALAASLSLNPQALIFDEALSQLDSESTELVKAAIRNQKALGKAVLLVEHDPDNYDIADRIYSFKGHTLVEVEND